MGASTCSRTICALIGRCQQNEVLYLIARTGYKGRMTGHGLRTWAALGRRMSVAATLTPSSANWRTHPTTRCAPPTTGPSSCPSAARCYRPWPTGLFQISFSRRKSVLQQHWLQVAGSLQGRRLSEADHTHLDCACAEGQAYIGSIDASSLPCGPRSPPQQMVERQNLLPSPRLYK